MCKFGKFGKSEYRELVGRQEEAEKSMIEKGFTGIDGSHQEYKFSKEDYKWHTGMTNFEFYSKNDTERLEACKKCPMWDKCSKAEHTVITMGGVVDSLVDNITDEINKKILDDIMKKEKFSSKPKFQKS